MSTTHTFMLAGADTDDAQLTALIRTSLLAQHECDRSNWLNQIELGLDGYGDRHRDTAARVLNILRILALEPKGAHARAEHSA